MTVETLTKQSHSASNRAGRFSGFPKLTDPRIRVAVTLLSYVIIGISLLGFNRSPTQVIVIVIFACLLDMLLSWVTRKQLLFPLSALITSLGLSILVNTSHGLWLPLIPVFCAIASKYLITIEGKHVYNPALFGLVIGSMLSGGLINPSPAYQWGGYGAIAAFIVTAALVLFVFNIKKHVLILSFLFFYSINVAIRAWLTRWHVPPETIILGVVTSPAFYLFTFFMLTDPATSAKTWRGQMLAGFCIAAIDLYLHKFSAFYTLFKAAFIYTTGVYFYRLYLTNSTNMLSNIAIRFHQYWKSPIIVFIVGVILFLAYRFTHPFLNNEKVNFTFVEVSHKKTGIESAPGDLLQRIDPRLQHISKWLLSVGDAVAVADVNQDGLQDIFLTYPLKEEKNRAALYINKGEFRFQRHVLPMLNEYIKKPEKYGLPSGALWFDYDNDSDPDLLILTGYGKSKLLRNMFIETQAIKFIDVSTEHDLHQHSVSLTANALDVNNDGYLDLVIGNAMQTMFDNDPNKPLSIFKLPEPEYAGDRSMFNFMHRSWHNADNGGENILLINNKTTLTKVSNDDWGLVSTRWTIDIGTSDFNDDGWTDLYLANDFGPDQLLLNGQGKIFNDVQGRFTGEIGRDTYKGMNASIGDLDGNGEKDIYVSNVHGELQAEGSLLWINDGTVNENGAKAFQDRATEMNTLNDNRFGWGAAIGDLDRDGRLDIVQANGMVSDNYDKQHRECPNYWYWNAKIALTPPSIHGYADKWADLRGRCIFENELNRIYLNKGNYFVDVATDAGWTRRGESRGIALVDLDNDGDLDAVVTRQFSDASIYRNDHVKNDSLESIPSWLGLTLKGDGKECNSDALGTKVKIQYYDQHGDEVFQERELRASNGFSAQGDSRILFGFGIYKCEVMVQIDWCGKKSLSIFKTTELNQYQKR